MQDQWNQGSNWSQPHNDFSRSSSMQQSGWQTQASAQWQQPQQQWQQPQQQWQQPQQQWQQPNLQASGQLHGSGWNSGPQLNASWNTQSSQFQPPALPSRSVTEWQTPPSLPVL